MLKISYTYVTTKNTREITASKHGGTPHISQAEIEALLKTDEAPA